MLTKKSSFINTQEIINFLNTETSESTEFLSRKITAIAETSGILSSLIDELAARVSNDGGFGGFPGYQSTVLDTVFALQALRAANRGGTTLAARALAYLVSRQKANGSWSDEDSINNVYTTALAVHALIDYGIQNSQVASSIAAADSYLLSQQTSAGLWASDFESAQALLALVTSTPDRSSLTLAIDSLISKQQVDGSWDGDVYTTALVLQLMATLDNPVANPSFGALQGKVIDGSTGYALSGAMISVAGPIVKQTQTDQDGNFEITGMPQGQYELVIELSDYAPLTSFTELVAGNITHLGTLSLLQRTDNTQSATIMGTVTDAISGRPIAGVKITSDTKTTFTGVNGTYQLNGIAPALVTVSADVPGYESSSVRAEIKSGVILLFSPILMPEESSTEATYVFGKIKDAETGFPLAGVNISIDGVAVSTTDSEGHFKIEALSDGLINVSASLPGYDTVSFDINVVSGNRYEFSPTLCRIGTSPADANTSIIRGFVMDSSTNQPLVGAIVTAHHDNTIEILSTGNTGEFNVSGISSAELALEFTHPGYQSVVFSIPIQPLKVADIGQIRLKPVTVTSLLPDLTITSMAQEKLNVDPASFHVTGMLQISIKNQGTAGSTDNIQLLAYYDSNRNSAYDPLADSALGAATLTKGLPVNASDTVDISLAGSLPFRDAPISVWVDSLSAVIESNETNNQTTTSSECRGQPLPTGTLDPVLKWHWSGSSYEPLYKQVMSTPVVAQLNDDNKDGLVDQNDVPDILFEAFRGSNYKEKGLLTALSGKDGKEIWEIPATPRWVSGIYGPAVGDIDHDGLVEIIINGPGQTSLMVFENNGDLKWSKSAGGAQPALADLNHDGQVEIIHGRYVFDSNGNILWTMVLGSHDPLPVVADLDNDDYLDVFAGGVAYNQDGKMKWNSGIVTLGSAIGNFDTDPYPEIVVKSRDSTVILLEHTGAVRWGPVAIPGGGGGPITVADFDGDGQAEIGTAGARYYVVLETDGSIKWIRPTQDISSKMTGSSVFDFEGDGKTEILYGDELYFRIFDGATGEVLFKTPNSSDTLLEYPVVADVDNDGHAEIVVVSNNYIRPGTAGIRVFENRNDNWMPTRSIWNQHAYHIDNVNDDGTIPQRQPAFWLTHNTYRLNTFADRSTLDQVDLTAGRLVLTDHGFGKKPSLSVRVGNAGRTDLSQPVSVTFHQGKPEENGILLGEVILNNLASGDYKDLVINNIDLTNAEDLSARVDADGRISECDDGNNQVSVSIHSASALGHITASLDAGEYGPNQSVHISAKVQNTGNLASSYRVGLGIEDSEGAQVVEFPIVDISGLSGGDSTSVGHDWSTGLILSGAYRLHGRLFDTSDNLIHEHTEPFTISNGHTPVLGASLSTDKTVYSLNDQVQLTARLINFSQNTILDPIHFDLIIRSPDNEIVFNTRSSLSELLPGASREFPFIYNLRDASAGIYQVELQIRDDATQHLMAVRHAAFTADWQLAQKLSGTVTASPPQQYQGLPVQCTETVTSLSDLATEPIRLISQLFNMNNGLIIDETQRTVTMGKGQKLTEARSIATSQLPIGVYACTIDGEIDGVSNRLAAAVFEIKAPPIRIDAELKKGDRGRILVLMDPVSEIDSGIHWRGNNTSWTESGMDIPSLNVQKHTLESLLSQAGWSYSIAMAKADFTKELHSGIYTSYLLLSKHIKLDESIQKELREAVYRGEGLIEAGSHDQRQGRIDDILGIKFLGKHPGMTGLTLLNTDVYHHGNTTFGSSEKTLKVAAQNAKILGLFSNSVEPAMISHQYGSGLADYFGFDLLAEISIPNADPLYSDLLLGALDHVEPHSTKPISGSIYPLQLMLTNRGGNTAGQAIVTLPSEIGLIDNGSAELVDNNLIWPFELIANQTMTFDSWISLPESPVDINAQIQIGTSPKFSNHTTARLSLTPAPVPVLAELIADAQFLDAIKYRHVIKYLKQAEQDHELGNYREALFSLIRTSDALIDLGPDTDAELRRHVAEVMRIVARKL